MVLAFVAATLGLVAAGVWIGHWMAGRGDSAQFRRLEALLGKDAAPLFVAGEDGRIHFANDAAKTAYRCLPPGRMACGRCTAYM